MGDPTWVDRVAGNDGRSQKFNVTNQITIPAAIKVQAFDKGWQAIEAAWSDSAYQVRIKATGRFPTLAELFLGRFTLSMRL
jgi:hypothetical protein